MTEKDNYIREKFDYFEHLVRTYLNSEKKYNKFTLSDLKNGNMKFRKKFHNYCEGKNLHYTRCNKKTFYNEVCKKMLKYNDRVSYDPDSKEYEYDEAYLNIDDESDSEEDSEEEEEEEEEIEQEEEEKEISHPYPLEWFKENRLAQFKCAKKIINELNKNKNVIVTAEEKSGKRIICEIISLYLKKKLKKKSSIKNYFYTALNRTDIHGQLAEQEKYGVKSKIIKSPADAKLEIVELTKEMEKNPNTISLFHIDECDYGSGHTQSLSSLYDFIQNPENTRIILYSATAEEAEYALQDSDEDWSIIPFTPDESYRGSKWYLDEHKVREAKNFLKYNEDTLEISGFSRQGKRLIKETKKSGEKNIIVCRITKSKKNEKDEKALTLFRNTKNIMKKTKLNYLIKR